MIIFDPQADVFQDVFAHRIAAAVIVIDSRAPWRVIVRGVIWAEGIQVAPFGPKVVVDNIEKDRQSMPVASIDEALQPCGPP